MKSLESTLKLLSSRNYSQQPDRTKDQDENRTKDQDKNPTKDHERRSDGKEKSDGKERRSDGEEDPEEEDAEKKQARLKRAMMYMFISYLIVTVISLFSPQSSSPDVLRYISWQEFYHHMLAKGEVESIVARPDIETVTIHLHEGAVIKGQTAKHLTYHMNIIGVDEFERKLRGAEKKLNISPENWVPVIYERPDESSWILLFSLLAVSLMILIMSRKVSMDMKFPDMFSSMTRARFTMVDPLSGQGKGVTFSDVAGLKEAKVEISEFVDYLKSSERFKALGAKVPKGVLLLGPPGCGKTLLAKAVATEASVPFLAMAGSEFIEMIGGLGAARVRDLFKEAKKRSPCIVYIDEIDAIGRQRSEGNFSNSTGEEEQTLNQLLVEMDGMGTREGIILLASTNRADILDRALLRPGRFDRHILIDYPTLVEREEIFTHYLNQIKIERPAGVYSRRMSQLTPGFSGADIANVVNESALNAARMKKRMVTESDLEYAVERVVGGTEKRTQVISPAERKVVAYHEAGHALVGWLLKHTDALLKVSIVPRTTAVLGFAMNLPSDQKLYSQEELFEKMCMALGGQVAELVTFNRISTGAEDDLKRVTEMAYAQVRMYGMDPLVGPLSFPSLADMKESGGRNPFSKRLAALIDAQSRQLVASAYKKTQDLLLDNRHKLSILAQALLQRETLNYDDVVLLIGHPPHGGKKLIDIFDFGTSENS